MGKGEKKKGLERAPAPGAADISQVMEARPVDSADAIQTGETLSPKILREVSDEVKASFRRAPAKPELVLIEVDPHRLHAFWTVSRETMEYARHRLGGDSNPASMILRVFEAEPNDAGSSGGAAFDVDVGGLQSRSYVDIFGKARRYRAELGLRDADNRFVTLATSNVVELPPASSAASNEFRQINIDAPEAGTFAPQPASPSHDALTAAFFPMLGPHDDENVLAGFPLPPGTPRGQETGIAAEASSTDPGWGAEALAPRPPLVLEQALTSSSYGLGRAGGFEVTAELHVHGHADPDRELHLFGQKIPMRPDGSFSIRRLLPNDPSLIETLLKSGGTSNDRGDG